ncbi:MAG: NAD(P)H-hydrate dehydratase [bacterium]|nr:NAD(P)H-hydrate dehydratase [bacterium]MBU1918115.1 NAD(P)H-hydrate dehydratase [bacterium]
MTKLPTQLYTATQVRELDKIAIKDHNISGYTLMTRAAKAAFDLIQEFHPHDKYIAVVCGAGNNAGDGFALASLAHKAKKNVVVFLLINPNKLKGDALKAYKDLVKTKTTIIQYTNQRLHTFDLIIDAIFGSGLSRNIINPFRKAVLAINSAQKPVLSLDLPSGIQADTGEIMGCAVMATASISFIGLKRGLFTNNGPECSGRIFFDDLGVPSSIYEWINNETERLNITQLLAKLPPRAKNTHKNNYGHTLIVGGNTGMLGAALLCATACLRTGSGLVSLATKKQHAPLINKWLPEVMSWGVDKDTQIAEQMGKASVIAIGPGLGQDVWAKHLFQACIKSKLPLVIDADALNLLAQEPLKKETMILTPHPGEAARLLGSSTAAVQKDRFSAIRKLALKYQATVILKGSGSLVCDPKSNIYLCDLGNPGMASGGMGDALTGIVAALIAQGLSALDAAKLGVCLHAKAADLAATKGERGLVASDLFVYLRNLVNNSV